MTSVAFGLAVLSLIGVIALAFAIAELHRTLRELQDGLRTLVFRQGGLGDRTPTVHEGLRSPDGRRTVYFATSPDCPVCAERLAEFAPRVASGPDRLVVVTNRPGSTPLVDAAVTPILDRELVGQLAIQATPAVVVIDSDGREVMRRVIADPIAMNQTIEWLGTSATDRQPESVT